jgi:hypothetical protein
MPNLKRAVLISSKNMQSFWRFLKVLFSLSLSLSLSRFFSGFMLCTHKLRYTHFWLITKLGRLQQKLFLLMTRWQTNRLSFACLSRKLLFPHAHIKSQVVGIDVYYLYNYLRLMCIKFPPFFCSDGSLQRFNLEVNKA